MAIVMETIMVESHPERVMDADTGVSKIKRPPNLRYAETCARCWHANGRRDLGVIEEWTCCLYGIKVSGHQVCDEHTFDGKKK